MVSGIQVNGVPLVQLPEKRMHVVKVDMGHAQRTKYAAWMGAGRAVVRGFIASETLLRNWAHVLQILTRYVNTPSHQVLHRRLNSKV